MIKLTYTTVDRKYNYIQSHQVPRVRMKYVSRTSQIKLVSHLKYRYVMMEFWLVAEFLALTAYELVDAGEGRQPSEQKSMVWGRHTTSEENILDAPQIDACRGG